MNIEKVEVDERDTWAYWKNKFEGMTEKDIDKYWKKEMEQATDETSILMDNADGVPEIRASLVREAHDKYMKAKAKHYVSKEEIDRILALTDEEFEREAINKYETAEAAETYDLPDVQKEVKEKYDCFRKLRREAISKEEDNDIEK